MESEHKAYLSEDQDLLDELNNIKPYYLGEDTQIKINAIQIKATLRNKKAMVDLDKSTSRYSVVLIIFAMVQIVVALSQLLFEVEVSEHKWIAGGVVVLCVSAITFILKTFDPDKLTPNNS